MLSRIVFAALRACFFNLTLPGNASRHVSFLFPSSKHYCLLSGRAHPLFVAGRANPLLLRKHVSVNWNCEK
jgi:hypothetical protein